MSDCVDREAVLDLVFVEYCKNCALTVADEACTIKCEDHRAFMEKIAKLPAVELERPKGKWKWRTSYGIDRCKCSVCGSGSWEMEFNYCPNCGARMEKNE